MATDLGQRLIDVSSAVQALLATQFGSRPNTTVSRAWVTEQDLTALGGQTLIIVLPAGAKIADQATRTSSEKEVRVSVRVLQRYDGTGLPPLDWLDAFVQLAGQVAAALVLKTPDLWLLGVFWSLPADVELADAANIDLLMSAGVGWAEIEATFHGIEALPED